MPSDKITRRITYKVIVDSIKVETHDVKTYTLRFEDPNARFDFLPGQFVMLSVPCIKDGKPVTLNRAYSIASSPTKKNAIDLTIKKSGIVTTQLDTYIGGEELEITGPHGHFTFEQGKIRSMMGIAAGAGIAPIWSIINYIIDKKLAVGITLLFSNKTPRDLIYKEDLSKIATPETDINVTLTITRPQESTEKELSAWKGEIGRIDKNMIKKIIESRRPDHFYVCGRPELVTDCVIHLSEMGIDKKRIHTEKF